MDFLIISKYLEKGIMGVCCYLAQVQILRGAITFSSLHIHNECLSQQTLA